MDLLAVGRHFHYIAYRIRIDDGTIEEQVEVYGGNIGRASFHIGNLVGKLIGTDNGGRWLIGDHTIHGRHNGTDRRLT